MSMDERGPAPVTGIDRQRARRRARFGRSDLDPDLLAAGLSDRLRSAPAWSSAATRPRARCGPASEPQHDPGGLSSFGRCRLRHESSWRRHPRRRTAPAAARKRGPGRARRRDAPPRIARRLHRGRGGRGDVRGRHRAQAPRSARARPVRRMHQRRRRLRRRAPGRRVPGHDRGRGRAARRPARPARALPLRPRGHDDVPRRRGPGARRRPRPGRRDARRARPMSSWSTRSPGCPRDPGSASCAPRDRGADNIRETLALSGTTGVEIVSALIGQPDDLELRRSHGRRHPHVARGARGRARRPFSRPDRIRPWTYDFDPSGLELLRRAIEHVAATRPAEARPSRPSPRARCSRPTVRHARADDADAAVRCFGDARPRLPRPA